MPFNTIEQGIVALQQLMNHECQAEENSLYLPLFGKRFASNEAATEDLATSMNEFISEANPKRVCALLGEGGSGKSSFLKQFTLKLLSEYEAGKPISLFVSLPLLTDPAHSVIEETLIKIGFNEVQIGELKTNHSFIFILDGYDEIHQLQNLYVSNRLSEWNAKTIISCRSQYLYNKENANLYFMPLENEREQPHLLQTLYVAPFNQDQIKQYIEAYNTITYESMMAIPGLADLITTPFLLKLAVEALPEILARYANSAQEERQQLTQTDLYKSFVRRWFEHQEQKLKDSGHITSDMPDQKPIFWRYCQSLALEMHKYNLSWLNAEDERFSVYFENDAETEMLRSACPIKKTENKIGFWHESLGMHFVAQTIYQESIAEKNIHVPQQVATIEHSEQERPQGTIHLRLITDDPIALRDLADEVNRDERYKVYLFDIVERSKSNENYAVGAANAISALNAAKISFAYMDLKNICIPYADLSEALMPHVDLSNSDLSNVNFHNAVLVAAKLRHAQLKNSRFLVGSSFLLGNQKIEAVACHPFRSDIVAYGEKNNVIVARLSDGVIEQQFKEGDAQIGDSPVNQPQPSVAWSPDGKLIAGAWGYEIRIWDITLPAEKAHIKTLKGHSAYIHSAAWSGDGILASGSGDGTIRLWNVKLSVEQACIKTLRGDITYFWSPDNVMVDGVSKGPASVMWYRQVFMRSKNSHEVRLDALDARNFDDNTIIIEQKNGVVIASWVEFFGSVTSLSFPESEVSDIIALLPEASEFSDNRDLLQKITSKYNCTYTLWSGVNSVAWSKENLLASGHSDNKVYLWNVALSPERICLKVFYEHDNEVTSVAWSLDGKLATASEDETIRVWDVTLPIEKACINVLTSHTDKIMSIAWSKGGELASASKDQTVRVWNTTQPGDECITTLRGHTDDVMSVAWTQNGKLISASKDNTIRAWDLDQLVANKKRFKIQVENRNSISSIAWLTEGKLAVGNGDNSIGLWDFSSGKEIFLKALVGHTDTVSDLAWSTSGKLASKDSHKIHIWDITLPAEDACLKTFNSRAGIGKLFSANTLAWSLEEKLATEVAPYEGPRKGGLAELFRSEANILFPNAFDFTTTEASGIEENHYAVYIWDVNLPSEQACIKKLIGHTKDISAIVWLSNAMLASGSYDNTIRIWSILLVTGQPCLMLLQGHTNTVKSLVWLPLQKTLVSSSWDRTLRVWDITLPSEQACIRIIKNHQSTADLALSQNQQQLIAKTWKEVVFLNTENLDEKITSFPLAVEYFSLKGNLLAVTHNNAFLILNLVDFPNKLQWVTMIPHILWLQRCDVTYAKNILLPTSNLLEKEGALSPDIALSIMQRGLVYKADGNLSNAKHSFEEALSMLETLGYLEDDQTVLAIKHELSEINNPPKESANDNINCCVACCTIICCCPCVVVVAALQCCGFFKPSQLPRQEEVQSSMNPLRESSQIER